MLPPSFAEKTIDSTHTVGFSNVVLYCRFDENVSISNDSDTNFDHIVLISCAKFTDIDNFHTGR